MDVTLAQNDVVLWGIGHTNAHVLRMWRMKPIPDARLVCVSDHGTATYSGMLPGVLAGLYPKERMEIDLVRLCASVGATLIVDRVTGLDASDHRLLFEERPPLPFDLLSVGIGSLPTYEGVRVHPTPALVPIKPMQTFLERLDARLDSIAPALAERPLRVVIAGGGAGGVEIALCLPSHVRRKLGGVALDLTLVQGAKDVVGDLGQTSRERVRANLERRRVRLLLGKRVTEIHEGEVLLDDGSRLGVDLILWATSATASPLLKTAGLPTDDRGFLLTRPTLQSVAEDAVFVVGDAGTIQASPTPKAGVYAVRQGPILFENLRRSLGDRPLREYRPQRGFLRLLNRGDGSAIGEFHGASFEGRWAWRLKDWIDSRFIEKYQDYAPMEPRPVRRRAGAADPMRCLGCGGKVGGTVLSRVLGQLEIHQRDEVLVGLELPDDAAVIRPPHGHPIAVTVDFFAAPLGDPFLDGRVAALHAASDALAMGSRPLAALALVTIPVGSPRQQENLLGELLAGSLHEFRKMGVSLVGGHTIEGPRVTIGFTILADQGEEVPRTLGRLRPGDHLVLTKPLGTGILLAAQMRAECRADWMASLLRVMLQTNAAASMRLSGQGVDGVTDITGFGLAGHLLEMLRASGLSAEIRLGAIPLLPGVEELVGRGVESTLAPANRGAETAIAVDPSLRRHPAYAALFDPQTSGGLLLGVPEATLPAVLEGLASSELSCACVIGRTVASESGRPVIQVLA